MKFKPVFRWNGISIYRLFRIIGIRGSVGDGSGGYSWKLSFALSTRPRICVMRSYCAWVIYIIFIRIGFQKSYGGIHV